MNVNEQNHLKVLATILVVLGTLSLPADLPYAVFVAIIFEFLGVLGYALAHYLADPATATADLQSVTTAITSVTTQAEQQSTQIQNPPQTALIKLGNAS